MVKNLPAMQKTWIRSLGWEDPLKESMVIHSSILAWRIPMDRGAWQATVHSFQVYNIVTGYFHALHSDHHRKPARSQCEELRLWQKS